MVWKERGPEPDAESSRASHKPSASGLRESRSMSSRILIVEDEPRIADFLTRGLSEEGYQVSHAGDGPSVA